MAGLPWPSPPLQDAVVALRPWHEGDIPAQLQAFADPVFERFSDGWPPRNEAEARRRLVEREEARRGGEQVSLAVVARGEDAVVLGGVSLHHVNLEAGRAEVGYWLISEARGRGVATRAVRLVCRWAFEVVGIDRLELTCGPDNEASQRVAERCGFAREGVLRSHMAFKHGRRDTVVFGLLPGELR